MDAIRLFQMKEDTQLRYTFESYAYSGIFAFYL